MPLEEAIEILEQTSEVLDDLRNDWSNPKAQIREAGDKVSRALDVLRRLRGGTP